MIEETKTIAESKNFIVLDRYESYWGAAAGYQSETDLGNELIRGLQDQGYEFLSTLTTMEGDRCKLEGGATVTDQWTAARHWHILPVT